MKPLALLAWLVGFALLADGLPRRASADALVVTRAMKASTIAQVFVEQGQIRVEMEIGVADLKAFKNILPDGSYEKLTGERVPLEDRLQRFLTKDWQMRADDTMLAGRINPRTCKPG